MATVNTSRTLHYRHAAFVIKPQLTLEQLLRGIVASVPLPINRTRAAGQNVYHVLNTNGVVGNSWCGMVNKWTAGQHSLVVEQDPTASVWPVTQQPPPQPPPGKKADYLDSNVYFGVRGNHVVVVQSQSMRETELAQYLTWLLVTHATQLVGAFNHLSFYTASAKTLRAAGVNRATGVRIKLPLADSVTVQPQAGSRRKKPFTQKLVNVVRATGASDALKALGVPVSPTIFGSHDSADLEVELRITRPRATGLSNSAMNQLGSLVAQHESDAYAVELPGGGVLKGSELRLSKDVDLALAAGSSQPAAGDVFKAIDDYLQHLVTTGAV